jgi:hypothetical protein
MKAALENAKDVKNQACKFKVTQYLSHHIETMSQISTYGSIDEAKQAAWDNCHCRYLLICTLTISPSAIDSAARARAFIRLTPLSSFPMVLGR